MSGDIIQLNPEAFQTELKGLVKNSIEETLNAMLDEEAKKLVNAERYAREEERNGYRAGHYDRKFTTTAGEVNLRKFTLSAARVSANKKRGRDGCKLAGITPAEAPCQHRKQNFRWIYRALHAPIRKTGFPYRNQGKVFSISRISY